MDTENATAAAAADGAEAAAREKLQPHTRIDWRTGRPMLVRGAAFWQEHAARRLAQGLSVTAYCEANGLAKSTFRRYTGENKPTSAAVAAAKMQPPAQPSRFVPIHDSAPGAQAMVVELETGGMKLRLAGAAAERLVSHVLARLA